MIWVFLSILAGFGDAVSFAIIKKLKKIDVYVKLMLYCLVALPFLSAGFLYYEFPKVSPGFYIIAAINAVVWITASLLLMKALQMSDLSISIPMLSFTPIFLLFVSYALLNEFPGFAGLAGIFVVVAGSYILNMPSAKYGYLEPFKSIFRNRGIFYMLIVAFLFSITASLAKIAINLSNPAYFMFVHYLIASAILTPLFFNKLKKNKKQVKQNYKIFLLMGIAVAFTELVVAAAFKLAIVPYVISLKRSSIVFSVLIGFIMFKEKFAMERIFGTALMLLGVILITLF